MLSIRGIKAIIAGLIVLVLVALFFLIVLNIIILLVPIILVIVVGVFLYRYLSSKMMPGQAARNRQKKPKAKDEGVINAEFKIKS